MRRGQDFIPDSQREIHMRSITYRLSVLLKTRTATTAIMMAALLWSASAHPQDNQPRVTGDILNLPVVLVNDQIFNLDFVISEEAGSIKLSLASAVELSDVDITGAATYYCIPFTFNCFLSVPHYDSGGSSLWVEFQITSVDPVLFILSEAQINNPGESGIEGKWRYLTENEADNCGNPIAPNFNVLTLRTVDSKILINDSQEALLSGNTVEWSGTTVDGAGTISYTTTLSLSSNSLEGSTSWTYSDSSVSCSGEHRHTGTLLHH